MSQQPPELPIRTRCTAPAARSRRLRTWSSSSGSVALGFNTACATFRTSRIRRLCSCTCHDSNDEGSQNNRARGAAAHALAQPTDLARQEDARRRDVDSLVLQSSCAAQERAQPRQHTKVRTPRTLLQSRTLPPSGIAKRTRAQNRRSPVIQKPIRNSDAHRHEGQHCSLTSHLIQQQLQSTSANEQQAVVLKRPASQREREHWRRCRH